MQGKMFDGALFKTNKREKEQQPSNKQQECSHTTDPEKLVKVCLLVDCTLSMQPFIDAIKKHLEQLIDVFDKTYGLNQTDLSFVGYRDFEKENAKGVNEFEVTDFQQIQAATYQKSQIYQKIATIKCIGGGDYAEDINGAIIEAITRQKTKNKGKLKFLFIIADAPQHGKEYNDLNENSDHYPNENMKESLKLLIDNKIKVMFLKVGDKQKYLEKTIETMKKEIQAMIPNGEHWQNHMEVNCLETVATDGFTFKKLCKELIEKLSISAQRLLQITNQNDIKKVEMND